MAWLAFPRKAGKAGSTGAHAPTGDGNAKRSYFLFDIFNVYMAARELFTQMLIIIAGVTQKRFVVFCNPGGVYK